MFCIFWKGRECVLSMFEEPWNLLKTIGFWSLLIALFAWRVINDWIRPNNSIEILYEEVKKQKKAYICWIIFSAYTYWKLKPLPWRNKSNFCLRWNSAEIHSNLISSPSDWTGLDRSLLSPSISSHFNNVRCSGRAAGLLGAKGQLLANELHNAQAQWAAIEFKK